MALCENPAELLIQKKDTLWYCPFDGITAVGWADPEKGKVRCRHGGSCAKQKQGVSVASNHEVSYKNVLKFGSELPTTEVQLNGTPLIVATHRKR